MPSIATILAAQQVDQKGVQSATKGVQNAALHEILKPESGDKLAYKAYVEDMQMKGIHPVNFKNWQIMFSDAR